MSDETTTVRHQIRRFEQGAIDYDTLLWELRLCTFSRREVGGTWAEIYRRCEDLPDPDDNSMRWVDSAVTSKYLTTEQRQQIIDTIVAPQLTDDAR